MSLFHSLLASDSPLGSVLKVYIITHSQSNAGGATSVGLPAQYTGPQNSYIWNNVSGAIERMEVDANNNIQGYPTPAQVDGIGPEVTLGQALAALAPNRVLFIKYLIVGSSMTQGSTNWSVASNTYYATSKTIIAAALAAAETFFGFTKANIDIKTIIPIQGEADADDAITPPATLEAAWKAGHTAVANGLITYLSGLGYRVSTCRLILARIHTYAPTRPNEAAVRAATEDIGDNYEADNELYTNYVAGSAWINNDALPTSDGNHYSQAGQLTMGTTLAALLTPHIFEAFVPTGSLLEEGTTDQDLWEDGSTDIFENRLI